MKHKIKAFILVAIIFSMLAGISTLLGSFVTGSFVIFTLLNYYAGLLCLFITGIIYYFSYVFYKYFAKEFKGNETLNKEKE